MIYLNFVTGAIYKNTNDPTAKSAVETFKNYYNNFLFIIKTFLLFKFDNNTRLYIYLLLVQIKSYDIFVNKFCTIVCTLLHIPT